MCASPPFRVSLSQGTLKGLLLRQALYLCIDGVGGTVGCRVCVCERRRSKGKRLLRSGGGMWWCDVCDELYDLDCGLCGRIASRPLNAVEREWGGSGKKKQIVIGFCHRETAVTLRGVCAFAIDLVSEHTQDTPHPFPTHVKALILFLLSNSRGLRKLERIESSAA